MNVAGWHWSMFVFELPQQPLTVGAVIVLKDKNSQGIF